jgi:hypothetical protein
MTSWVQREERGDQLFSGAESQKLLSLIKQARQIVGYSDAGFKNSGRNKKSDATFFKPIYRQNRSNSAEIDRFPKSDPDDFAEFHSICEPCSDACLLVFF